MEVTSKVTPFFLSTFSISSTAEQSLLVSLSSFPDAFIGLQQHLPAKLSLLALRSLEVILLSLFSSDLTFSLSYGFGRGQTYLVPRSIILDLIRGKDRDLLGTLSFILDSQISLFLTTWIFFLSFLWALSWLILVFAFTNSIFCSNILSSSIFFKQSFLSFFQYLFSILSSDSVICSGNRLSVLNFRKHFWGQYSLSSSSLLILFRLKKSYYWVLKLRLERIMGDLLEDWERDLQTGERLEEMELVQLSTGSGLVAELGVWGEGDGDRASDCFYIQLVSQLRQMSLRPFSGLMFQPECSSSEFRLDFPLLDLRGDSRLDIFIYIYVILCFCLYPYTNYQYKQNKGDDQWRDTVLISCTVYSISQSSNRLPKPSIIFACSSSVSTTQFSAISCWIIFQIFSFLLLSYTALAFQWIASELRTPHKLAAFSMMVILHLSSTSSMLAQEIEQKVIPFSVTNQGQISPLKLKQGRQTFREKLRASNNTLWCILSHSFEFIFSQNSQKSLSLRMQGRMSSPRLAPWSSESLSNAGFPYGMLMSSIMSQKQFQRTKTLREVRQVPTAARLVSTMVLSRILVLMIRDNWVVILCSISHQASFFCVASSSLSISSFLSFVMIRGMLNGSLGNTSSHSKLNGWWEDEPLPLSGL